MYDSFYVNYPRIDIPRLPAEVNKEFSTAFMVVETCTMFGMIQDFSGWFINIEPEFGRKTIFFDKALKVGKQGDFISAVIGKPQTSGASYPAVFLPVGFQGPLYPQRSGPESRVGFDADGHRVSSFQKKRGQQDVGTAALP